MIHTYEQQKNYKKVLQPRLQEFYFLNIILPKLCFIARALFTYDFEY